MRDTLEEGLGLRKVRRRVRVRVPSRRRRVRRMRIALLILGILLALCFLAVIPALAVRARLDEAGGEAERALSALLVGDAARARDGFFAAEDAFLRAQDQAENPLFSVVGLLPVLGRTPDSVENMARAGALLARSGKVAAGALAELPEEEAALAPDRGRVPLAPLRDLAPALADAREWVLEAQAVMEGSPRSLLLGPVGRARVELTAQLDRAERAVTATAAMTRTLPPFLGGDGPRRYFVAAQNPAELRGTGGFMGVYAILTAREGRLRLGPFSPIQTLPDAPLSRIEPPNRSYAERWNSYGGAGFWRNINMTADVPSAATAMERLYEEVSGRSVDGALLADPFALATLMEATGPVRVPRSGRVVDSGSMVPFVTNEAYALLPGEARKRLLGDMASRIFDRFLGGRLSGDPAAAATTVIEAAAGGHLVFHSVHGAEQEGFVAAGVSGRLGDGSGDFLAVVANNAAGNKVDFYAERTVDYDVRLGAEGTGIGVATVDLTNHAPSRGQPAYVIGPYSPAFRPGENVSLLDVYCAAGAGLNEFRLDGRRSTVGSQEELGHPVFQTRGLEVPSGGSRTLKYELLLSGVWEGGDSAGMYRLTFRGQSTIRPTSLSVEVQAPEGMHVVSASPGMEMDGGRAVWAGPAPDLLRLEVRFERPLLAAAWRAIIRFLRQPLFHVGQIGLLGGRILVRRQSNPYTRTISQ